MTDDVSDQHDVAYMRTELTREQRSADMRLSIDPGFVHHRKCQAVFDPHLRKLVNDAVDSLPLMPDYERRVRVDRIYTDALLLLTEHVPLPTLNSLLAAGCGQMFCATVRLAPAPEMYDQTKSRAVSRVVLSEQSEYQVELHYSKDFVVSDTLRSLLNDGHRAVSVIGQFHDKHGTKLIFHPLLMGMPWLSKGTDPLPFSGPEWYGQTYFENFVEDIDEFSAVKEVPPPADYGVMGRISESAFKACLGEILGDEVHADWGGEQSDHFTAHTHLAGKRMTAAFLLKGPAGGKRFNPMTMSHLGKNSDQIYRLAQEPAGLLVVQHCHEITSAVRATLRAFAVQPGNPRRYCLIDGRDSLRLLLAYGKLDRAIELSG